MAQIHILLNILTIWLGDIRYFNSRFAAKLGVIETLLTYIIFGDFATLNS